LAASARIETRTGRRQRRRQRIPLQVGHVHHGQDDRAFALIVLQVDANVVLTRENDSREILIQTLM
jgi:hypothetical protein